MVVRVIFMASIVSGMLLTGAAAQTNWPQFRGIGGGVIADDPELPETWGPDENIA